MSFYNMLNGYNQAVKFIGLLDIEAEDGTKVTDIFAKFRDCFLGEDHKHLKVMCRLGAGNRNHFKENIEKIKNIKGYIKDYDLVNFDCTYCIFEIAIAEKHLETLEKLLEKLDDEIVDSFYKESDEEMLKIFSGE